MAGSAAEPVLKLEVQLFSETVAPGGCALVRCHGRLVAGQTQMLLNTVNPLLKDNKRVVLDLSDLQHTDSMGLGALVKLYVTSRSTGSSFELTHLSQQIRNLLGMTNLLDVLTIIGERNVKLM